MKIAVIGTHYVGYISLNIHFQSNLENPIKNQ